MIACKHVTLHVTENLQFNNLEELVIEKGQHMFQSLQEADVVETSKSNFSQIPYTSMIQKIIFKENFKMAYQFN